MSTLERALWEAAATREAVGLLTAQWLRGEIQVHPHYLAPGPDEETSELIPVLAALNEWGFITDGSQPGSPDYPDQRAFVGGFADGHQVIALNEATMRTRLVVLAFPPGQPEHRSETWLAIPVTLDGDREFTWVGGAMGPRTIRLNFTEYHPHFVDWLADEAWQVTVLDPEWERNDLLWPILGGLAGV